MCSRCAAAHRSAARPAIVEGKTTALKKSPGVNRSTRFAAGGPMQRTWSGPPPAAHSRRPGALAPATAERRLRSPMTGTRAPAAQRARQTRWGQPSMSPSRSRSGQRHSSKDKVENSGTRFRSSDRHFFTGGGERGSTRAMPHGPAAVSDGATGRSSTVVNHRGNECTAHRRTGAGGPLRPEWLRTSSAPTRPGAGAANPPGKQEGRSGNSPLRPE
jgi:hypothetical protein